MKEDWIEIEINEVANLYQPKTISSKMLVSDGKYPVYGANGIIGNYDHYNHENEEFLITCRGATCGNVHISQPFSWINGNAMVVQPYNKSLLSLKYLRFVFSNKGRVQKAISGSAQPQITRTTLSPIKIPLSPLPEQRAIVTKIEELFSDLDKGIADLKKAQDQLKVYRQAVLKKAFEGELTKQWREQQIDLPTAAELFEQIKEERQIHYEQQIENWEQAVKAWETNGKKGKKPGKPKEPKYFEDLTSDELKDFKVSGGFYTKMGNLSDVVRGGSPRPAGDERFYNGSIPFLKVADLTRKEGMYVDTYTYSIKEAGLQKTRMLDIGTLVISNSGATLGVPKITAIKATANDGIAAFLGLTESRSIFLYHYWNSKTLALRAIDQGAGQPNLNTDLLKAYPVPVFSDEEQTEIVKEVQSRLSVCDKVEESITESLEKSQALRQSILKKAFEGDLLSEKELLNCKNEVDYEPASELLKRIKNEKR